jgi:hypothetical protein
VVGFSVVPGATISSVTSGGPQVVLQSNAVDVETDGGFVISLPSPPPPSPDLPEFAEDHSPDSAVNKVIAHQRNKVALIEGALTASALALRALVSPLPGFLTSPLCAVLCLRLPYRLVPSSSSSSAASCLLRTAKISQKKQALAEHDTWLEQATRAIERVKKQMREIKLSRSAIARNLNKYAAAAAAAAATTAPLRPAPLTRPPPPLPFFPSPALARFLPIPPSPPPAAYEYAGETASPEARSPKPEAAR